MLSGKSGGKKLELIEEDGTQVFMAQLESNTWLVESRFDSGLRSLRNRNLSITGISSHHPNPLSKYLLSPPKKSFQITLVTLLLY